MHRMAIFSLVVTLLIFLLLPTTGISSEANNIVLTNPEKLWLAEHPAINVRVSSNYPPFEFFDDGSYKGLAYDYLAKLGQQLGLTFNPVAEMPWSEALQRIKDKNGVDLILLITRTQEREGFLDFTRDYLSFPEVIFTRKGGLFVSCFEDLEGHLIATEKDFIGSEKLLQDIKQVRLLETETTAQALKAVALGEADAYVGNLAVGSYLIENLGLVDLKIAAPAPYGDDNYAMGVRNDWPELVSILDKGLNSLSAADHQKAREKWLAIRYEHGLQVIDIFMWVGGALIIALIFIVQLRRMVKTRTSELQQMHDELETLVQERTSELKTAQKNLLIKERLAVLGKLTATVSHELRNPLGTISNSLYNMRLAVKTNNLDMIAKALDISDRNIQRSTEIIDDLLDYGCRQSLVKKIVNIDRLLEEIVEEFVWNEEIKVETHFNSEVVVSGDMEHLRRAVLNLITNSQQALFETPIPEKRIILSTFRDDKVVNISIEDNGPGVPEALREKIFEPLFSTKNFGVGLGMAIVKDIMSAHQGGVRHELPDTGGCRFVLWMPL